MLARGLMRLHLVPLLFLFLASSCGSAGSSAEVGQPAWFDSSTPADRETFARLLAFTSDGDLAVVDSVSGDVLAKSPGVGPVSRDLVFDPWRRRAITFDADEGSDGGELATWSVDRGGALGPRVPLSAVDGDVRLLAAPVGTVVFEESYGRRWRVISNDGVYRPSASVPLPTAVWVDNTRDRTLHSLVHDEANSRWGLAVANLDSPLAVSVEPLSLSLTDSARLLPSRDMTVVVDAGPTFYRLKRRVLASTTRVSRSGAGGNARGIPLVAQVTVLDDGATALVLTEPATLHACALSIHGDVDGHTSAILEGRVDARGRMFTRAMVTLARRRVVVATDTGVFAYDVRGARSAPILRRDWAFRGRSLRGPIAVLE